MLDSFKFKPEVKELFNEVVIDRIRDSYTDKSTTIKTINQEIEKNKKRLENIQDKFVDNEITKEEFNQLKVKYNREMDNLIRQRAELNALNNDISAQLEFSLVVVENLSDFYSKADTSGKQQIPGSIFTDNLVFSGKKVRTKKLNEVVSLIVNTNKAIRRAKNRLPGKKTRQSYEVIQLGFELCQYLS